MALVYQCKILEDQYNEFPDRIKVVLKFKMGGLSNRDMEIPVRNRVEELFSEGGYLYGYGSENDLYTDYEKNGANLEMA